MLTLTRNCRTDHGVRTAGNLGPGRRRAVLTLVAAVGTLAVLAGCGSNSASPAAVARSASPATSVAATPSGVLTAGGGACKYVTVAQAVSLAMSPLKAGVERTLTSGPITFKFCDYNFDPGTGPGVTVGVADLGTNGPSLFAQFRADKTSNADLQPVPGVGDEAFYSNGNLNVRKGKTGLILFVGRNSGYPRGAKGVPDEMSLAALVLPQL